MKLVARNTRVVLDAEYFTADGMPFDPTLVRVEILNPSGVVVTTIVPEQTALGKFQVPNGGYLVLQTAPLGVWQAWWFGTINGVERKAIEEFQVTVEVEPEPEYTPPNTSPSTSYAVHWAPDPQSYAIDQERGRHDQALWSYGQYGIFCLLWRIRDHNLGLVDRCSRCYLSRGKVAETYGQAAQEKCPECFGTTFEGGYKALIVRPVMWNSTDETEHDSPRGVVISGTVQFQTTSDFEYIDGDYIFIGDGSRWQLNRDSSDYLITGFETQTNIRSLSSQVGTATKEDESSVAYLFPPTTATLVAALDLSGTRYPVDFSVIEDVRGPIL